MKKTKVIINSVTVRDTDGAPDPKQLFSWEHEKDDEEISEAIIYLPKSVEDIVSLTNGQVVEIWSGWTTSTDKRYFYGFIEDIEPIGARYKVTCRNEMIMLVRKNVNHIYDSLIDTSAGEVSEIVEDLIETYGGMNGTVQPSGTADGQKIDQFKCINEDIFSRIIVLKKALDWDLYYNDNTRVVFFEPKGYNDSGITLTVGTNIAGMPEWSIDDSKMINDLRIDGATIQTNITETGKIETTSNYLNESILLTNTPDIVELYMDAGDPPTTQKTGGSKDASIGHFYYVDKENKKIMPATSTTFTTDHYVIINYVWSARAPIHMRNQASIDKYKIHEAVIKLTDISSVADAESRATNILASRSSPLINGKLLVKSEAANIPNRGEKITIIDERTPKVNGNFLSGEYVVNKITYKFPSAVERLEVGDKRDMIVDWQQTVEERLKLIENQLVGTQDILMELINIHNIPAGTGKAIYRQVQSRDVSADELWSRSPWTWNSGTWSNTYLESLENHFIQHYLDTYIENFDLETFEDTNGTASWSDTGSVTFTSGQIALSSSIDYNNGTITTATLNSTEVSGSFDYEMAADGSTFESVTPGVAHTFSVTGTDLRFRITENAASTGEISQVIITDYH